MKTFRLKIGRDDFEELRRLVLASLPEEAGAFALAGIAQCGSRVDILVRRVVAIPASMMPVQNAYRLEVAPRAINGLVALCEANNLGAVICHAHPAGLHYSRSDDYGEARIAQTLRQFIPASAPIASLLFTPDAVMGRVWLPGDYQATALNEIIVIGHHIYITVPRHIAIPPAGLELHDRQTLAFGTSGQMAISNAKIAIVGVGGTGSAVAEQLMRLGVLDLLAIDPDGFSPSNLSRVYGTYFDSVRCSRKHSEPKVALVVKNLKRINPRAHLRGISRSIVEGNVATLLLDRDIVALCTDEHWGRSIVNQVAYQYLIPTINVGMQITARGGVISDAVGSVDVLRPGLPCLWCRQLLRSDRIAAESLPRAERLRLQNPGYVEDIDSPAPSVISMTTTIAATAVSIILQLLTNYMGSTGEVHGIRYDFLTGEARRGATDVDPSCVCNRVRGFGDLTTLPTLPAPTKSSSSPNYLRSLFARLFH